MTSISDAQLFRGFRFPPAIIQHAIWLYFTFPLSYREVELMLAQRHVQVSHEAIRNWCRHFGPILANKVRQKRPRPTDKLHLDEVFVKINGRRHYLWRAVDSDGTVLDILMQERRNASAAKAFFKQILKTTHVKLRVIVTDALRSYNVISNEIMPEVEHRKSKYLNNRAENSHLPTRRRERRMQHFKSSEQAQNFLSTFGIVYGYFHPKKHKLKAEIYQQQLANRFEIWSQLVA